MGAYTGSILTDTSIKSNLQELSDAIEALPSGLEYQGTWDASTNTPTLASSPGIANAGDYYIVSVAGSTNLDGITDWGVGDWAVVSSTGVWQKIDNSDNVTSVNGQSGTVVLDSDDISEGVTNLYYTETRFDSSFSGKDTDDLTEGVTNLYFTNTRADARISAASIDDLSDVDTTSTLPNDGDVLTWVSANNDWEPAAPTGGGGGALDVELHVAGGNGHGSTNTKIRRYSTVNKNTLGAHATYTDSATLGGSVTIATAGIWKIVVNDRRLAGTDCVGISINTSAPTSNITNLNYAQGGRARNDISSDIQTAADVLYLSASDVIRCHTNGNCNDTGNNSFISVTLIAQV